MANVNHLLDVLKNHNTENDIKPVKSTRPPLLCSCCGTIITCPQFHNGKAYGYTCILKVAPNIKRTKDTGLWAKADKVEKIVDQNNPTKAVLIATINGFKFSEDVYQSKQEDGSIRLINNHIIVDGIVKIAKHYNGTKGLWNNTTDLILESKEGKKHPVKWVDLKTNKTITDF